MEDFIKIVKYLEKTSWLLGTLGTSLLGLWGFVKAGGRTIREGVAATSQRWGRDFKFCLILWLILRNKNIIKMNLNLKVFIQEITYLRKRMRHI